MFVDSIFKEEISFEVDDFHFSFQSFITKIKAIIIEMFWNDKTTNPYLCILDEFFIKNQKDIEENFYSVNRKCRNNLHYSDYHNLTKREEKILMMYQDVYLNNVIDVFNQNISYNFGLSYKIWLLIAKLEYWSRKRD